MRPTDEQVTDALKNLQVNFVVDCTVTSMDERFETFNQVNYEVLLNRYDIQ